MTSTQASNSKNQNPCEIAGALEAACLGFGVFESVFHFLPNNSRSIGVYELGPLPPGMNYLPPQKGTKSLECDCSTVMFRYMVNLRPVLSKCQ